MKPQTHSNRETQFRFINVNHWNRTIIVVIFHILASKILEKYSIMSEWQQSDLKLRLRKVNCDGIAQSMESKWALVDFCDFFPPLLVQCYFMHIIWRNFYYPTCCLHLVMLMYVNEDTNIIMEWENNEWDENREKIHSATKKERTEFFFFSPTWQWQNNHLGNGTNRMGIFALFYLCTMYLLLLQR